MPRVLVINGKAAQLWTARADEVAGEESDYSCPLRALDAEGRSMTDHSWWAVNAQRRAERSRRLVA